MEKSEDPSPALPRFAGEGAPTRWAEIVRLDWGVYSSGTTAVASISTCALSSSNAATTTKDIGG